MSVLEIDPVINVNTLLKKHLKLGGKLELIVHRDGVVEFKSIPQISTDSK